MRTEQVISIMFNQAAKDFQMGLKYGDCSLYHEAMGKLSVCRSFLGLSGRHDLAAVVDEMWKYLNYQGGRNDGRRAQP